MSANMAPGSAVPSAQSRQAAPAATQEPLGKPIEIRLQTAPVAEEEEEEEESDEEDYEEEYEDGEGESERDVDEQYQYKPTARKRSSQELESEGEYSEVGSSSEEDERPRTPPKRARRERSSSPPADAPRTPRKVTLRTGSITIAPYETPERLRKRSSEDLDDAEVPDTPGKRRKQEEAAPKITLPLPRTGTKV